ncbi:hypothetical protein ACI3KS_17130 [Microbacterium sp. ZW T5_45]|uniref:hypothetical protein n=1 Tax=Microbacterium sp. ZW T5_45 TaxID=3378080 RepID=UPI0038522E2F
MPSLEDRCHHVDGAGAIGLCDRPQRLVGARVAATAILGSMLFAEPFTVMVAIGIAVIIGGVVLVETGSHQQSGTEHKAA